MNKLLTLTMIGAVALSGAAFAATDADINADAGAVAKDNAAIANQQGNIAVNRDEKAAAKAKGGVAGAADQASQSVQIGANKTAIQEKKVERKADKKILAHDKANANASATPSAGVSTSEDTKTNGQ